MKTLLIWESFGEAPMRFYILDEAPEWLPKCHDEYLNACDSDEVSDLIEKVYNATCENPDWYIDDNDELAGAWVSKKVEAEEHGLVLDLDGGFRIVVTGQTP